MVKKPMLVLSALLALGSAAYAGDTHHKGHAKAKPVKVQKQTSKAHVGAAKSKAQAAAVKAKQQVANAVCPVTGDKIPAAKLAKALKSVYQGKTYYFCCPSCKPTFDKNPAKYARKA